MDIQNNIKLLLVITFLSGCGVKGRPVPPLTPPPLGRGEPTFSEKVEKKKTLKKENTPYPEGDGK